MHDEHCRKLTMSITLLKVMSIVTLIGTEPFFTGRTRFDDRLDFKRYSISFDSTSKLDPKNWIPKARKLSFRLVDIYYITYSEERRPKYTDLEQSMDSVRKTEQKFLYKCQDMPTMMLKHAWWASCLLHRTSCLERLLKMTETQNQNGNRKLTIDW